jgi:type II secretory pathway component PulF
MAAWLRDWWWLLPIGLLYLVAAIVYVKWSRSSDDDHQDSSW